MTFDPKPAKPSAKSHSTWKPCRGKNEDVNETKDMKVRKKSEEKLIETGPVVKKVHQGLLKL